MNIEGRTVVFTGKISIPRHKAQKLVIEHGGIPGSSVTRKTDYLVVGGKPGSKLAKATLLHVQVLTEKEFWDLLRGEKQEEEPLTKEELAELQSHTVQLVCRWCKSTYKQWNTLPVLDTCPVCEILSNPKCPHCDSEPIYVEDYNLYHCMLCGTWFEAPFSSHARKVKHLHMWIKASQRGNTIRKTCPCGASINLTLEDENYRKDLYERAPHLVEQWRQELVERQRRVAAEEEARRWFESLSEEQVQTLKEQLNELLPERR